MPDEPVDPLVAPEACSARRAFARTASRSIASCGSVLWAFGLVEDHNRRALAVMMQTADSLVAGTLQLLDADNLYAASALVRQLVEVEYLLWLFRNDAAAATDWLTSTDATARSRFRPAKMRQHAGQRFQAAEYRSHCEMGGHPHPRAGGLLPERYFGRPDAEARLRELLWLDFAVHLDRVWKEYESTRCSFGLVNIVVASDASVAMRIATESWVTADRIGNDAVQGRAKLTATH